MAAAKWISSDSELTSLYTEFNKLRISDSTESVPDIDFSKYGVIYIAMGQKPTGGYSLSFDESLSIQADNKATIGIRFNRPGQGAVLTQAVTSPYIMLKLSKDCCSYADIINEEKQTLFEIDLK